MIRTSIIENPAKSNWKQLCSRPSFEGKELSDKINEIFKEVSQYGDVALKKLTAEYDKITLSDFSVSLEIISIQAGKVDRELREAINVAAKNIRTFHLSQKTNSDKITTSPGVRCWQEVRPINTVGLYIPGGTAPLFSTILMLAIPAQIAGCKEIILCTPPQKDGTIHPAIAYCAKLTGVSKIFLVGGAQAIAGMTLGTKSIPKVQKIFGPGNQFVTAAKQYALSLGSAIDMPAGPSELLVICDETSIPAFVASDLLSQAEHGPDSQVICISSDIDILKGVLGEVSIQLDKLPRKETAKKALLNSKFILLSESEDIIAFSNEYAPEHLIIASDNYKKYIDQIENAGSVFLGKYSPESAGDYASGTNHTLPTAGFAKQYSGVNLDAFVKKITFQEISVEGINNLGKTIEVMAEAEGLFAHKNAVSIRLEEIKNQDERN